MNVKVHALSDYGDSIFGDLQAGQLFTIYTDMTYNVYMKAIEPEHGDHIAVNLHNGNISYIRSAKVIKRVLSVELN